MIFNWKKEKEEIKKLIHLITANMILLETEKRLQYSAYQNADQYYQTREESPTGKSVYDLQYEHTMSVARLQVAIADAKERLKELGVY